MTQPPENHPQPGGPYNPQPGGQYNAQPGQHPHPHQQGGPLPQDLSAGWLPEDRRQKPVSPLPEPKLFGYQSMLPPKVLHALRHPAEIPWLVAAYAVTAVGYTVLFISFINLISGVSRYFLDPSSNDYPSHSSSRVATGVEDLMVQAVTLLILGPIVLFIVRAIFYAQQRVSGVRITPTQFPEAYQMLAEAAEAAGLRRVPDAYVIGGNGTINAFAAGHGFRRYICIYSDMFEIGGKSRDPQALRFVIGHEVGHIAAGHVSYFRLIFTILFNQVPLLSAALSRAQEYTADNFGYRFCPEGAPGAIKVMAAGKYLNKQVNFDELADRAVTDRGLAVWYVNLMASHPVTTWRAHALRDRTQPGRLFWRPTQNPVDGGTPRVPVLIPASEPVNMWPDPIQSTEFMRENQQVWESHTLETVDVVPKPEQPVEYPANTALFTGWLTEQARAFHAQRWDAYAAAGGAPVPGAPGGPQADFGQAGFGQPGFGAQPAAPDFGEQSGRQYGFGSQGTQDGPSGLGGQDAPSGLSGTQGSQSGSSGSLGSPSDKPFEGGSAGGYGLDK